ncbi:MAG: OmpA family protein [Phycisphaerales bacterium]|nr:OmpA family protein [Phycisphaerales bacterium]
MRFLTATLSLAALIGASSLTGCTQGTVDDLRNANRVQAARIAELEQNVESLNSTTQALRQQVKQADSSALEAERRRAEAASQLQSAMAMYADLEERLNSIDPVMLPPELDEALRQLAAAHPELMVYDPKRGMVQLTSDLTFDLGSADLKGEAQSSLQQLADVLKGASASTYEVRIVGHTDNVPIRNVGTRAKHPTNVHLSVHRAISVRDAIVGAGVAPGRCSVAGWGEFRPVVANPAAGGARANRRVEIFLVPSTYTGGGSEGTPEAAPSAEPVSAEPEPLK